MGQLSPRIITRKALSKKPMHSDYSSPACHNQRKPALNKEDLAQPKINKLKKKKEINWAISSNLSYETQKNYDFPGGTSGKEHLPMQETQEKQV